MKQIGAFVGFITVMSMLFPLQTGMAFAASMSEDDQYESIDTQTSNDAYQIELSVNYETNKNKLAFTLGGKKYSLGFYGYSSELMLCAAQKAIGGTPLDINFMESFAKVTNINLYFTLRNSEKLDCVKNTNGFYESLYATSSPTYAVNFKYGNPHASSITVTPKNSGVSRTVVMDYADIDLFSCAFAAEEGVTFATLDKNLLALIVNTISASYDYNVNLDGYYTTATEPDDCIKNTDGVYRKQYTTRHGDYAASLYTINSFSSSTVYITVNNTKTRSTQEIVISGYYNDASVCAVEDVLGVPFEKMDTDLRMTIAELLSVNVDILEEVGSALDFDCVKDEHGVYAVSTDTQMLKEKIAAGIEIVDAKIDEVTETTQALKRNSNHDEYWEYEYAFDSIHTAKESLRGAKASFRSKDYSTALFQLRESITTLLYTQYLGDTSEGSYEAYIAASDALNTQFIALKKKGTYDAHIQKFEEIMTMLEKANALSIVGSGAESIALSNAALVLINTLK